MRAALMILMVLAPAAARGADVLVVLNKPLAPSYREAFDGIRAQWGEAIETASAGRPLPSGPHGVIVALGAHAAARARSGGAPVVAALAPAYRSDGREPAVVRVAMTPSPERATANDSRGE